MNTCKMTIDGILRRNGLEEPDGRQLCMYRCTDDEYDALRESLGAVVSSRSGQVPGRFDHEAASLCLYASEWWRRCYLPGHWSWSEILETIGLDPQLTRLELYDPLRRGLRYWRRKLLSVGERNAYFVTVACEGGLPLNLVGGQDDCHVRQYLRALLREFRVYGGTNTSAFEIASRLGEHLPKSLRQKPLFQICGEVIEKVWQLQKLVGGSANPIEELDRLETGWRDTFPLVVPDDVARVLLNSLVSEAVKIARIQELRCTTVIVPSAGGYVLRRTVKLPSYMDARSLAHLLDIPATVLPYQMQLHLRPHGASPRLLALVTRRTAGDEGRFALETPTSGSILLDGPAAVQSVTLEVRATGLNLEIHDIKGGLGLSVLPWVFVEKDSGSNQWELVGEGSLKTAFQEVLLAVSPQMKLTCDGGQIVPAGDLSSVGRLLFRVSGTVDVIWEEGKARVSTKASIEESAIFVLSGDFLSSGVYGETIYRGVPRLLCQKESGSSILVPADQIEWKTRSSNDAWKKGLDGCCGPVTIRLMQDDGIRFMTDIDVVPAQSKIAFIPGTSPREGSIIVSGTKATECGISPIQGIGVVKTAIDGEQRLDFVAANDPPAALSLHLRWQLGQELVLQVPYPSKGVRFLSRDGNILGNGSTVHLAQMSGVTVQMMDPNPKHRYRIEASVVGSADLFDDSFLLQQPAPGRHEIDLRQLQESCDLMLSGLDTLDAKIKIRVLSDNGQIFPQNIEIARYDVTLEPNRLSGEVVIPEDELKEQSIDWDKITLQAFPLPDPLHEPDVLPMTGKGRWQFMKEGRAPGPWLITGWEGDWCRLRPLCWTIPDENPPSEESEFELTLASVVSVFDRDRRLSACKSFVNELADNPGHPDWKLVDGYFPHIKDLPPSSFDIVQSLSRKKKAAVMALFRAGEEVFDTVWVGLERLPFVWYLVSIDAWLHAAVLRKEFLSESLAPYAEVFGESIGQMVGNTFVPFFNQGPIRVPGLRSVVELLKVRVFNANVGQMEYLFMCSSQIGRQQIRQVCLDPEEQELLQRHADSIWPTAPDLLEEWWPRIKGDIPAPLIPLWKDGNNYRSSVLNAPIAAGLAAGFNLNFPKKLVFKLRALRAFDQAWFDNAYGCTLAMCIGYRLENRTI